MIYQILALSTVAGQTRLSVRHHWQYNMRGLLHGRYFIVVGEWRTATPCESVIARQRRGVSHHYKMGSSKTLLLKGTTPTPPAYIFTFVCDKDLSTGKYATGIHTMFVVGVAGCAHSCRITYSNVMSSLSLDLSHPLSLLRSQP